MRLEQVAIFLDQLQFEVNQEGVDWSQFSVFDSRQRIHLRAEPFKHVVGRFGFLDPMDREQKIISLTLAETHTSLYIRCHHYTFDNPGPGRSPAAGCSRPERAAEAS